MAVLQYKIPDIFQPGFDLLANLYEEQFEQLQAVLQKTTIGETSESLAAKLVESLSLVPEDARILGSTIFSMYYLLLNSNSTVQEIAIGLGMAYRSANDETQGNKGDSMKTRMEAILSTKSPLFYTVKSRALFGESLSVFEDCRIITDIRLTFDNQMISDGYKGGMVIHNLKIIFRENQESINMIISCDSRDLEKIRTAIDRALEKDKAIRDGNLHNEITFVDIK